MRNSAMNKTTKIRISSSHALISLVVLLTILHSAPLKAEGVGSTSASFLSLPMGGKSTSMGEVQAALMDDPFNWLSNPATPCTGNGNAFGIYHSQWILNTYYDNAFYRKKVGRFIAVGAGFGYMSSPDINGFDELGEPTGSITDNSLRGLVGLTVMPVKGLSFGINLNYFQEKLADWTARGYSTDLGIMYRFPVFPMTIGVALQNLGPNIKFLSREEELPLTFRTGLSYRFPVVANMVQFGFAADVVRTKYEETYAEAGGELIFNKMLSFRAGVVGDGSRESSGFTAGVGVRFMNRLSFDYAWTPYGDLGSFHRLSIYFMLPEGAQ